MTSSIDNLVYMANQIARNFATLGDDATAKATADHIASFWDPRMKAMIIAHLDDPACGLDPCASKAVMSLRNRGASAPQTRMTESNAMDEAGRSDAG